MQPLITPRLLMLLSFGGLIAFVVTLLATPVAARWAKRFGAMAVPRGRDVHDVPVPRWGGLAILFGFLVSVGCVVAACEAILANCRIGSSSLEQGAGIVAGGILISIVGAMDDRQDLRPLPRLAGQIAASLLVCAAGVRVDYLTLPLLGQFNTHWLAVPLTAFWMLLLMNAINWLDGLDGLAGGVSCIVATFMAAVALSSHQVCLAMLCVALAGSTLGFLRHNYSPARIYMGGGAEFLGLVLASVSIVGAFKQITTVAFIVPLVALAVPIIDSIHVVFRRAASGARVYEADRRHFHHVLVDMGLTKEQAVLILYGITAALCLFAWVLFRHSPPSKLPPVSHPGLQAPAHPSSAENLPRTTQASPLPQPANRTPSVPAAAPGRPLRSLPANHSS